MEYLFVESMTDADSIDVVKHELQPVNVKIEPENDIPLPTNEVNVKSEIDIEYNNFVNSENDFTNEKQIDMDIKSEIITELENFSDDNRDTINAVNKTISTASSSVLHNGAYAKMNTKQREQKMSEEQKTVMLEFMKENDDFARGKLLGVECRKTWANMWEILATRLNSVEGPQKSTSKWQRAWTDLKQKVKKKATEIKVNRRGRGAFLMHKLTDFEERLIAFMKDDVINGLEGPDNIIMETEEPIPGTSPSASITPTKRKQSAATVFPTGVTTSTPAKLLRIEEPILPTTRLMSPLDTLEDSNVTTTLTNSSDDDMDTGKRTIKKKETTTQDVVEQFTAFETALNDKLDIVAHKLDQMIEERRVTNKLLERIAISLENK